MTSRSLSNLLIVGCLAALGAWWWSTHAKEAPKPVAVVRVRSPAADGWAPPTSDSPELGSEQPVAPPSTTEVAVAADPSVELRGVVTDMIQLLASGDFKTIVETLI